MIVDKQTTDSLKGLSAIVVMLYHLSLYSDSRLLSLAFYNTGQLAVAVFLFMSGYGLTVQYQKKGEKYLNGFWLTKICRLIIVFLTASVIVTIINNIYYDTDYGILSVAKSALRFCYPNGRELWFVAIIIFCYFCFYIGKKYFNGNLLWTVLCPCIYIFICFITNRGSWWYNTAFCFVFGELVALYKKQIDAILLKFYVGALTCSIILFLASEYLYRNGVNQLQYFCPVIFLFALYLLIMKVQINSRVLQFLNRMTFELYLVHLIVYKIFFDDGQPEIYLYAVMYIIILLLAYITMQIDTLIFSGINRLAKRK